jgi:hypothetical protein
MGVAAALYLYPTLVLPRTNAQGCFVFDSLGLSQVD